MYGYGLIFCVISFQGHRRYTFRHVSACETLTFEIGAWFFCTACCFDMPNPCAKLYYNPTRHMRTTVWIEKHAYKHWTCTCIRELLPGPHLLHFNIEASNGTLTFEIGAWLFRAIILFICQTVLPKYLNFFHAY